MPLIRTSTEDQQTMKTAVVVWHGGMSRTPGSTTKGELLDGSGRSDDSRARYAGVGVMTKTDTTPASLRRLQ